MAETSLGARTPLAHLPTPLVAADRLGAALGLDAGTLWIKHDDMTGLAGGGNKVRKLEYLCADALAANADVLLTGGGRQSNHVRMTAAAANRLGLDCVVVLASDPPDYPTGNVVIDHVLAPEIIWAGNLDYYPLENAIDEEAERLRGEDRAPYPIPIGGASVIGALGYVAAADELVEQIGEPDLIVVADGSGGTHAGLVAGLGHHDRVLGIDVGTRPDLDDSVPAKAAEVAQRVERPEPGGKVQVDHDRFGDGYGEPTTSCREALDLAARTEGLVLDPVYTGKAMAGLIAAVRDGRIMSGQKVVFLHTGGLPALFARRYAEWVTEAP